MHAFQLKSIKENSFRKAGSIRINEKKENKTIKQ